MRRVRCGQGTLLAGALKRVFGIADGRLQAVKPTDQNCTTQIRTEATWGSDEEEGGMSSKEVRWHTTRDAIRIVSETGSLFS
jgi:hypothetical protein